MNTNQFDKNGYKLEDAYIYHPLTKIEIKENIEEKVKYFKGKVDISKVSVNDPIAKIIKLLGINYPYFNEYNHNNDIPLLFENIIEKLECVPYCQFPISFSTVDMIALYNKWHCNKNYVHVLLGKKWGQDLWQFPGGFVDPGEIKQEAASREFHEECGILVNKERFIYKGDLALNDERYKDTPHKITTNIFTVKLNKVEAKKVVGGDDIQEVKWFPLNYLIDNVNSIIRPVHLKLYDFLINNKIFIYND